MKIGYARVSTIDQCLDLQHNALSEAGCDAIFSDLGLSGATSKRPELNRALMTITPHDQLVVWKLDRLGRSLSDLITIFDQLSSLDAGVLSLTEGINTAQSGGKMIFQIMGVLAEFERDIISERTREGMKAARLRGVHIGRPLKLSRHDVLEAVAELEAGGKVLHVARRYNCARDTLLRSIEKYGLQVNQSR